MRGGDLSVWLAESQIFGRMQFFEKFNDLSPLCATVSDLQKQLDLGGKHKYEYELAWKIMRIKKNYPSTTQISLNSNSNARTKANSHK